MWHTYLWIPAAKMSFLRFGRGWQWDNDSIKSRWIRGRCWWPQRKSILGWFKFFVLPRFSRNKMKQTWITYLALLALSPCFCWWGILEHADHVVEVCLTSTNSILKAPCPSQLYKLDGESGNLLSFPGALHFGCRSRQPTFLCFRLQKIIKEIPWFCCFKNKENVRAVSMWSPTSFTEGDAKKIQQVYGQQVLRCPKVV